MSDYDFSGRTLNQRYVLQRQIGAGAFATVYVAQDLRMFKRKVAIKVLNPERRLNPGNVERFIQEVKVAAKIDGPYRDRVVKIIDQGRCDVAHPPLLYLVMEHVEGITLQSLLRPAGPEQPRQALPWTQAVSIVRELLKALATLHDCGVVHRDIKPGNCILEQRPDGDYLKLLDLGIVKVMPGSEMSGDNPMTQPEFVLGTPRYMAPEQFGGPCSDPRVDLYAAGIMLYEFLTGDVPSRWAEQTGAKHPYEPLPPSHINAIGAIPPELDALALRAIAFVPEKRFQSAVEFAQALSEVLLANLGEEAARRRARDLSAPVPAATTVATSHAPPAPVAPPLARPTQEDAPDRFGSALRWWTIASTTCTAMVFVFAFASLLRRAESRPALDLESDEAPAVVEASRARPSKSSAPPPVAAPVPTPAPEPAPAPPPVVLPPISAPPVVELPPSSTQEPESRPPRTTPRPRKPKPPPPEDDVADELMPIKPRG
jgi:serine/threonine protein kinase